jgi:hypothetical protein
MLLVLGRLASPRLGYSLGVGEFIIWSAGVGGGAGHGMTKRRRAFGAKTPVIKDEPVARARSNDLRTPEMVGADPFYIPAGMRDCSDASRNQSFLFQRQSLHNRSLCGLS